MKTTGIVKGPLVLLPVLPLLVLALVVPPAMVPCLGRLHAAAPPANGTVIVAASQRRAPRRSIELSS
jgi:hypothetical protein